MLHLIKKSTKYAFGIMPLAAVVLIINLKKSPETSVLTPGQPVISNHEAAKKLLNMVFDLPCGFKSQGAPQLPEKPTFTTNNDVPILQYPAGNFGGTAAQVPNVLFSEKKSDQLILQADGNLVIYCLTCNPTKAIWSSQTNGKGGQSLFFQTNGDLVLKNATGKMIWHSNIISKCAGSEQAYFTLQDDGNLVMLYNQKVNKTDSNKNITIANSIGSTASTNNQVSSPHPGKIQ